MQHMNLYHYYRSSCSWRVRWALLYKNLQAKMIPVNLLKGEQSSQPYKLKNPAGFVPCLEIAGEFFGESMAILEWLEETHPAPPLLPSSPTDRLKVRQLSYTISAGTQPLQNLEAQKRHSSDREEQLNWARYWISRGFEAYEKLVSESAGEFSWGSQLTFADLCLIPQMYNAKRFGVTSGAFPTLERITRNCMKLESCRLSAPENYEGA